MFSKIMYTTLFVTDQDQALDFYTTMFGFEKRVDYPGPEGRFLTIGFKGQALEVILWPGVAEPANEAPRSRTNPAPGILLIESDNLRKDFAVRRSHGVNFAGAEPEEDLRAAGVVSVLMPIEGSDDR